MKLPGKEFRGEKATARWWSPARGVFCTEVKGQFTMDVVDLFVEGFDEVLAFRRDHLCRSFHDLAACKGYDTAARVAYTERSKRVMVHVEMVEMFFASRIVAMGIEVANVVIGGKVTGTADRAGFERRRDEVIAARIASEARAP